MDGEVSARIPADVGTPDTVLYSFTARQVAYLAAAAALDYLAWRVLGSTVPLPVLAGILGPGTVVLVLIVLGRRDGVSLETWLRAAWTHRTTPAHQSPAVARTVPGWAPQGTPSPRIGVLRLPARAISDEGVIELGGVCAVMVAAETVNIALRTPGEQAGLIATYARWLNSLTSPVQIRISTTRVDLTGRADHLAQRCAYLDVPALAEAGTEHAEYLRTLADDDDLAPLARTITITHTTLAATTTRTGRTGSSSTSPATSTGVRAVLRHGEHTAAALAGLGARTQVLDGQCALAVLTGAIDPYAPTDASWPRALPETTPASEPGTTGIRHRTRFVRRHRDAGADAGLAAVTGPAAVHTGRDHVRVGDAYVATLVVTGYPAEVGPAWLEPVLSAPARVDVALHINPLPAPAAAAGLRRQRARLESTRRLGADHGRLEDPQIEAAATDAADLAECLARGQARLFRLGLYVTVHAPTQAELADAVALVRACAAGALLDVQPATWRHLPGWTTSLPLGTDAIGMSRVVDTDTLAVAFPLASSDLPAPLPGEAPAPGGVLYGLSDTGVLWWDRWAQDNHNSVILARSGAGKSYLVKLEILRSLFDGVHVAVIDPEDEYARLTQAVGGVRIALGAPGVCVNPLDIPSGHTRPDELRRRAMFVHTLVAVLLGAPPAPDERAALDAAITCAYAAAGITPDPTTWDRPAPLLGDLAQALAAQDNPVGPVLAARLAPWTTGTHSSLFAGPTTWRPTGRLVTWSLRRLPDELRAAGMLLALDAIWRDVDTPTLGGSVPRRLVVVDEAWTLLREDAGARFLYKMAKASRKRRAGLAVITQDAADVLGSELGQAVIANAATQILMRQAPQAIEEVTAAFALTRAEAQMLTVAPQGTALLLTGTHKIAFEVVASPAEHALLEDRAALAPEPGGQGTRDTLDEGGWPA